MSLLPLAMIDGDVPRLLVILLFVLFLQLTMLPPVFLVLSICFWFSGERTKARKVGIPAGLLFAIEVIYLVSR